MEEEKNLPTRVSHSQRERRDANNTDRQCDDYSFLLAHESTKPGVFITNEQSTYNSPTPNLQNKKKLALSLFI